MIRILRLRGASPLTSADVFESGFAAAIAGTAAVTRAVWDDWTSSILAAPEPDDAARFAEATRDHDVLAPDYLSTAAAPRLAHLRNVARAGVRLLVVAHAPGVNPVEWALLAPELRAGDRIVAPSRSAAAVLVHQVPAMERFVRVVPHPVLPLPTPARARPPSQRLVSMTRIHPWKLVHRQIDVVARLRTSGRADVTLDVVGPTRDAAGATTSYADALRRRSERLAVGDRVRLLGEIRDRAAAGAVVAGSALFLAPSVTVEESFGKAVAEALGCGVPVLTTSWDGLPETVGPAGRCVPVVDTGYGMDVDPDALAAAARELLDDPPSPATCRDRARRFRPEVVGAQYRVLLEEMLDDRSTGSDDATPSNGATGLLARSAPLAGLDHQELFALHVDRWRTGPDSAAGRRFDELRALTIRAVARPVGRLMAGLPPGEPSRLLGPCPAPDDDGTPEARIAASATGPVTCSSRVACAGLLAERGRAGDLRRVLDGLDTTTAATPARHFLEVESRRLDGLPVAALEAAADAAHLVTGVELAAPVVAQLLRTASDAGDPWAALPVASEWLRAFPDAVGAAAAHHELHRAHLLAATASRVRGKSAAMSEAE